MRPADRGFTLLEVMIALSILGMGLSILVGAAASNVDRAKRAELLGVATNLARGKMLDIEEELIKEGFQELDQDLDGDFGEEGYADIEWEARVEKVELPGLGTLQAAGAEAAEGGEGEGGGLLGGIGGGAGEGNPAAAAGAGLIGSQFELIANILEQSIRRVTLTVTWKVRGDDESMVVSCYFTDPKGVDEAMLGGDGGDGAGEGDDTGGGGGSSAGSGGSGGRGALAPSRGGLR